MKVDRTLWRPWLAILLFTAIISGIVLMAHRLDPRPGNEAMREEMYAAIAPLRALDLSGMAGEDAFLGLAAAGRETSSRLAAASIDKLSDANLRDFAERLMVGLPARTAAPIPSAQAGQGGVAFAQTQAETIAAIEAGIAHKGVPDQIFARAMLGLFSGAVATATLAQMHVDSPETRAAAEEALLLDGSALGSFRRWLQFNGHH